jgi:uncharacterized protein
VTAGESALIIDAFAFARQGKEASGTLAIGRLVRLLEELPQQPLSQQPLSQQPLPQQAEAEDGGNRGDNPAGNPGEASGLVTWSVQGRQDSAGQDFLRLHVKASPTLVCQRCLTPFVYPIDSESVMQLVLSADDLDSDVLGDEPDDEDFVADLPEKVIGSHRFDLLAQIEDELLLSIPYVPKHDVCPGARPEPEVEAETFQKPPSPFAVLEKLKQKV